MSSIRLLIVPTSDRLELIAAFISPWPLFIATFIFSSMASIFRWFDCGLRRFLVATHGGVYLVLVGIHLGFHLFLIGFHLYMTGFLQE
jgi:hypothetical protein